MANPEIRIHNLETGQIIDREMTTEEYNAYKAQQAEAAAQQAEADAKASARASALAKLAALGLTSDEIASL
jgi:DNA-binding NarL/FixJ family response regulator